MEGRRSPSEIAVGSPKASAALLWPLSYGARPIGSICLALRRSAARAPALKREAVAHLKGAHGMSERRACKALSEPVRLTRGGWQPPPGCLLRAPADQPDAAAHRPLAAHPPYRFKF